MPRPVQNLPSPKRSEIKLNPDTRPFTKSECQEELIKWVDKQGCKCSRAAKTGEINVSTFNALEVNDKYRFKSKTSLSSANDLLLQT